MIQRETITFPEELIPEHSHSLKDNMFSKTQKYQNSRSQAEIVQPSTKSKKSAKINLSNLDKMAFDKMALREEKISKRKMMKFMENTENMNKKVINLNSLA